MSLKAKIKRTDMKNEDKVTFKPEDRILFIINDNVIHGSTRFQKYGFLVSKQHQRELKELQLNYSSFEFYDDWIPHNFGPYSKKLQDDLDVCIENKIISKIQINRTQQYSLTLKGRVRWRKFLNISYDEIKKINEKISILQTFSLYGLLKSIHDTHQDLK